MVLKTVWKVIKRVVTILFSMVFILCIVSAIYLFSVIKSADPIDVSKVYDGLPEKTIVYDGDGKEMDILAIADGDRTIVKYKNIPKNMINAIVSIEDKTFWDHHGFNIVRLIGAMKNAYLYDSEVVGTSTITQQLARNVFLADIKGERTLHRKVLEAYYAVQIEKNMTKEQIIEAYLNTVYFGFGSYGIDSAAENYFSKDLKKLDLYECAALAALPQSPDTYSLVGIRDEDYKGDDVVADGSEYKYVNNYETSTNRRMLVLDNMVVYGYITKDEATKAKKESIDKHIKLNSTKINPKRPEYYEDYVIDRVIADLMDKYDMTEGQALNKVYCGGLRIYTCIDRDLQEKVKDQIEDSSNYTSLSNIRYDWNDNILDNSTGKIMLWDKDNWFDEKNRLVLDEDDFKVTKDGKIVIYGDRFLSFTKRDDGYDVNFDRMYVNGDYGEIYSLDGGYFVVHDKKAKVKNGDFIITKEYIQSEDSVIQNKDSKLYVKKSNYVAPDKIRQPQAAAVLIDNKTTEVKAMVGGRGQKGKFLYNRAASPHQTGSSIKPLSVYGPALQKSVDYYEDDRKMSLISRPGDYWGSYITAGSIINDAPMTYQGKEWPRNASGGFMGRVTFRKALQQSINTCAVKIWQNVGVEYSIDKLKKNGITTIVEDSKVANDKNPAALALGGQTVGVSPLEMAAAYCTFSNNGVYRSPKVYTKVTDANGKVILDGKSKEKRVFDKDVNWIMRDILKTVVTQGIAGNAQVYNMPTYGKTGTTSSQHEIWFCGGTPYYTMALWEGNDTNLELGSMSGPVASFWKEIMNDVHDDLDRKELSDPPDSVVRIGGEYYVKGTK